MAGSKGFIQTIRQIQHGALHVVCGVRKDQRQYRYHGNTKRCRKLKPRYYEVMVHYAGIGEIKLYVCRFRYQKQWRVLLSTDTTLSFVVMMEIYATG